MEAVSDEYLTALANKGIVKRAYKDKETADVKLLSEDADGPQLVWQIGDEQVTLVEPLAESRCSCPSRSMCRHIILGILAAREVAAVGTGASVIAAEEHEKEGEAPNGEERAPTKKRQEMSERLEKKEQTADDKTLEESGQKEEKEVLKKRQKASGQKEAQEVPKESQKASGQKEEQEVPKESQKASGQKEEKAAAGENSGQELATAETVPKRNAAPVWDEIASYPLAELRRVLGTKRMRALLQQKQSGLHSVISGEQVLTVTLPGMKETVKLISPIAYAACTCHKKELCSHKASAILWCQLAQGSLTEDMLRQRLCEWENKAEGAGTPELLVEQAKQAAEAMQKVFCEMAASGLSRMSSDTVDALERLAAISHNTQLPRMENEFRALAGAYDKYFKRAASIKCWELVSRTVRLYQKTEQLRQVKSQEQIELFGGEFRADYLPVGDLELAGVTEEVFTGAGGYAGITVYFLEYSTKKWYTYTHLRPTFYDSPVRRGSAGKAKAPWNLPISFEELSKVRLKLTGAKCESQGRLSMSQDTKGEVQGRADLTAELVEPWYYTDFAKLFLEQLGEQNRAANPIFLAPEIIGPAVFTDKSQRLTMPLYDSQKREVIIEIRYSREEEGTIRYLERLRQGQPYVFLGKIYVKESRIRMYPLALWERKNFAKLWNGD